MRRPLVLLCILMLACADAAAQAAPQGLDEMARRKARLAKAVWPYADFTAAWTRLDWQPETLCFTDAKTGHEVWRVTATPNVRNYYHNDIAMSPWSADGRRLALQSWRAERGREVRNVWMVVDSTGARLRPTVNADAYCHWSPVLPDVYYTFGGTQVKGITSDAKVLYKVTVSDDGPATAMQPILTFPKPQFIGKLISADGRMILAGSSNFSKDPAGREYYEVTYTPAIISPDDKAKRLLETGWTVNRDFGDYVPPFKGGHYHDKYLLGDGTWLYAIDRAIGYWRLKTLGSAPDGGPRFTGDDGKGNFGEMIPEYVRKLGKLDDPWKENQYPGHPGFDRWGELVNIANYDTVDEKGAFRIGCSVYDFINHKPVTGNWFPQTDGATHCDWSAFADWSVVSVEKNEYSYGDSRVECFPYDQRGKNFIVCYTNNFTNGGKAYYNYIRPAQSPDGTKVAWHSDFLNSKDSPDCYWSVCYYPAPPTDLNAVSAADGGVKLTWKLPAYTRRGWPKKTDAPPPAREVRRVHVWRSEMEPGPWKEVGAVDVVRKLDESRAVMEPVNLEFVDEPRGGQWHYALTSEEWSGIESRELSEVVRVFVRENAVTETGLAAKAGRKGFWTLPPREPSNVAAKKLEPPGHALLSWDEPDAASLSYFRVRYYNVYYSTAGAPQPLQENRIASLPVGTKSWLDWLADPEKPGFYAMTSVDRLGNESAPVAATAQ